MALNIPPLGLDFSNLKLIYIVSLREKLGNIHMRSVVVLHKKKKKLHEEKCVLFPFASKRKFVVRDMISIFAAFPIIQKKWKSDLSRS